MYASPFIELFSGCSGLLIVGVTLQSVSLPHFNQMLHDERLLLMRTSDLIAMLKLKVRSNRYRYMNS